MEHYMQGAREYATLFSTGQYGRLYLSSHCHARGKTFHIYVLPEGEAALPNGPNGPLNKDAVEVYGITGGQPGWTETYGWLHRGKWEQDFAALVEKRGTEIAEQEAARAGRKFIGCEVDRAAFDLACERIAAAYAQGSLLDLAQPVPEQQDMGF